MLVQRRIGVANLNGRAHALMCAAGALGEREVVGGDVTFDRGDRVLVRRNDRGLGVVDGDHDVVTRVDPELGRIDVDSVAGGCRFRAPSSSQPTRHGGRSLMHGYALTVHLAQGMTHDPTLVLVGDQLTREAGYVPLSRGRQSNRLYVRDSPE